MSHQLPELPAFYGYARHSYQDVEVYTADQMRAYAELAIASVKPSPFTDTDSFKNFHRNLCKRFGYAHDDAYWWRDLMSLEEWIAASVKREPLSDKTLTDLWFENDGTMGGPHGFGRAIEQAHGISLKETK